MPLSAEAGPHGVCENQGDESGAVGVEIHGSDPAGAADGKGPREPVGALAVLVEEIDRIRHVDDAAAQIARFARATFDVDAAGVSTLGPHGGRARLAGDEVLVSLDAATATTVDPLASRGPSGMTHGIGDGAVVVVADALDDRRWPDWSRRVAEHRMRAVVLAGMPALRERPVVLELYSHHPRTLPDADLHDLRVLAKHAGIALRQVDRIANLREAVSTRALIGQAQGILMERYGLTSDQAMAYLRRRSQESQHKVRDLAEHLVAERDRAVPEGGDVADTAATDGPS